MPPRKDKRKASATMRNLFLIFGILLAVFAGKYLLGFLLKYFAPPAARGGAGTRNVKLEMGGGDSVAAAAAQLSPARAFVEQTLRAHRVVVFSKSYCPYSMKGKDVMRKWLGEDGIEAVELDERADGGEVQDALLEITGGRTVPRIFVDGKFIGGADDVTAMDARGDLEALLRENSLVTAR